MTKESAPRHLMKGLTYSPMKSVLAVLLLAKRYRAEIYLENRYIKYSSPSMKWRRFAFLSRASSQPLS